VINRLFQKFGIACDGVSLTFSAQTGTSDVLTVYGGQFGAGIGTNYDDHCNILHFRSGSSVITGGPGGGAGIGTGASGKSSHGMTVVSSVSEIEINDGIYNITTPGGAGIGTGESEGSNGISRIASSLRITGGTFNIVSNECAGIGTGASRSADSPQGSHCLIDLLDITGSPVITSNVAYGAAIGTGRALAGETRINWLRIYGGTINTHGTHGGAGIGIGDATKLGISEISQLEISATSQRALAAGRHWSGLDRQRHDESGNDSS
jgi:hypothetical protein